MISYGKYLYIVSAYQPYGTMYIVDTDNPSSFTTVTLNQQWGDQQPFTSVSAAPYANSGKNIATNGTIIGNINAYGGTISYNPAVSQTYASSPPPYASTVQRLNSTDVIYGGSGCNGLYYSSNLVTTLPTIGASTKSIQFNNSSTNNRPKKVIYSGSTYYVCADGGYTLYSGSTLSNLVGYTVNAVNSNNVVSCPLAEYVITNGSYLNFYSRGITLSMSKITNPNSYITAGTMTANIVEIS